MNRHEYVWWKYALFSAIIFLAVYLIVMFLDAPKIIFGIILFVGWVLINIKAWISNKTG